MVMFMVMELQRKKYAEKYQLPTSRSSSHNVCYLALFGSAFNAFLVLEGATRLVFINDILTTTFYSNIIDVCPLSISLAVDVALLGKVDLWINHLHRRPQELLDWLVFSCEP